MVIIKIIDIIVELFVLILLSLNRFSDPANESVGSNVQLSTKTCSKMFRFSTRP